MRRRGGVFLCVKILFPMFSGEVTTLFYGLCFLFEFSSVCFLRLVGNKGNGICSNYFYIKNIN